MGQKFRVRVLGGLFVAGLSLGAGAAVASAAVSVVLAVLRPLQAQDPLLRTASLA